MKLTSDKKRNLQCFLVFLIYALPSFRSQAQGSFTNLNFESANIPLGTAPQSDVPIFNGIPGWNANFYSAQYGNFPQKTVVYDGISGGGESICINDANTAGGNYEPLAGNFTAALFGGIGNFSSTISQTGTVPTGTESLRFIALYN